MGVVAVATTPVSLWEGGGDPSPKKIAKKVAPPMQYFAPLCIYIMKTIVGKNEPKHAFLAKFVCESNFCF